jgi:prophage regulatory protein
MSKTAPSNGTLACQLDGLAISPRRVHRILREVEVAHRTGLTRKQRLRMEKAGQFPVRVPLAPRVTGWLEEEIERWIEQRLTQRDDAIRARRSPNPLAKTNRQAVAKAARSTATSSRISTPK